MNWISCLYWVREEAWYEIFQTARDGKEIHLSLVLESFMYLKSTHQLERRDFLRDPPDMNLNIREYSHEYQSAGPCTPPEVQWLRTVSCRCAPRSPPSPGSENINLTTQSSVRRILTTLSSLQGDSTCFSKGGMKVKGKSSLWYPLSSRLWDSWL